jgi:preprotein translocase subunit SecG
VSFLISLLNVLVVVGSLFLVCLVLIQRGKGGGLAGAFGGAGGSSAFGTKAGDVFTRITMITALIWIVMLMILVILSNRGSSSSFPDLPAAADSRVPAGSGKGTTPASEIVPPVPTPTTEKASPDPPGDPRRVFLDPLDQAHDPVGHPPLGIVSTLPPRGFCASQHDRLR